MPHPCPDLLVRLEQTVREQAEAIRRLQERVEQLELKQGQLIDTTHAQD